MSAIIRADALALPLGDATVDLVVTSPPYFALRSYQDGGEHYDGQIGSEDTPTAFLEALWAVMGECWRVLKPSGSVWVNLGDKYAGSANTKPHTGTATIAKAGQKRNVSPMVPAPRSDVRAKSLIGLPWRFAIGCIDGQADPEGKGWILRAEAIWAKPNGLPESVTDRVRRSHEQWFHFTKEPRYFCDIDPIREAHITDPAARPTWDERRANGEPMRAGLAGAAAVGNVGGMAGNPLGKLPDSVWTIPTQPLVVPESLGVDHFAAFPTEWPRRIITAWSPSGGVVLDPFGGTGTTAMVAKALGRFGVSVDLSADYLRLANWRINESDHVARVQAKQAGRTYKPAAPEMDGQASIFDMEAS